VPGLKVDEATNLLGKTAQLEFRVYNDEGTDVVPAVFPTQNGAVCPLAAKGTPIPAGCALMSGQYLKNNTIPERIGTTFAVSFETTGTGSRLMEEITSRALGYGAGSPQRQLLVTAAQELSDQLNNGALPVPLKVIQSSEVSATLGEDSVLASVHAGLVGLVAVALFMILYYRLPGVLAALALVVYTSITLAVFKLYPVTLTLSGIAAFVLSVGMAVDANILIFERMKEELRRGHTLNAAIDLGFRRAWTSIRDSNISTLMTCVILYYFGNQFGASLVKGFALTLAIGVAVSMFSAITVTRTFLKMVVGTRLAKNHWLFNAEEQKSVRPGRGPRVETAGGR
jgi:protein-export SecD/SecF family membrane protein